VDYVKKEVAQGYSVEQIRAALIKYGYPEHQIDEAISKYNQQINSKGKVEQTKKVKPKKSSKIDLKNLNINFKKIGIIVGAIILIIILISMINFLLEENKAEKEQESELILNIESIQTTISPGQEISFLKRISYDGETKISFSYTLKDRQDNIILTDYEDLDIKNSVTSRTDINSGEIEPGQYTLDIIAKYDGNEIKKSIYVKVYEESEQPSCFDNIKNQNETDIDCGGPCLPCEKCPLSCDDGDECTEDYCNKDTNYQCVHDEIIGCNEGTTQTQQQTQTTPLDSGKEKTMYEVRKELYDTIETNPEQAINICHTITVNVEKDLCIKSVAELTNTSSYCSQITKQLTKDSCYMKFVINNNEFQHCSKIEDSYLKDSCLALEQINS
jgi:hypothetical protein